MRGSRYLLIITLDLRQKRLYRSACAVGESPVFSVRFLQHGIFGTSEIKAKIPGQTHAECVITHKMIVRLAALVHVEHSIDYEQRALDKRVSSAVKQMQTVPYPFYVPALHLAHGLKVGKHLPERFLAVLSVWRFSYDLSNGGHGRSRG